MSSRAKTFDHAAQNLDAAAQLRGGDELARAVRDAYVAGAEDDRVRAEFGELRRLRAERDGARAPRGRLFERAHERRVRARLHPPVEPRDVDLADEILVPFAQPLGLLPQETRDQLRRLPRHGPPFEREAALARDDVL